MKNSFLLFFLFCSCNYNFVNHEKICVSVPYIQKDFSGLFTNELIKQISFSANMEYKHSKAPYILNVSIIENKTQVVGFKYDRNNLGQRLKNLRAVEGRQSLIAKVELIDAITKEVKIGPFQVFSDADFDYVDQDSLNDLSFINSNGGRTTVLSFSLGQVESVEDAKQASLKPLYQDIAKKIVDAISVYW